MRLIAYIVIFIGVAIVSIVTALFKYKKANKAYKSLAYLKNTGHKIFINLEDCELKTREYYDKEPSDEMPSRVEIMDSLYNPNQSYEGVHKVVSVLIYRHTSPTGQKVEFRSELIEMPAERIRFAMEKNKKTTIYVDKNNRNLYYFDISFLFT